MRHLGTIVMGTVTAGLLGVALPDTLRDTSEPFDRASRDRARASGNSSRVPFV